MGTNLGSGRPLTELGAYRLGAYRLGTNLGSGGPLTALGAYRLGAYRLGAYRLGHQFGIWRTTH